MAKTNKKHIYVIKLSGSLFFSQEFKKAAATFSSTVKESMITALVLVAGGGPTARTYIEADKHLEADQSSQDEIGIAISRLNAAVLIQTLGKSAFPSVPSSLTEIVDAIEINRRKATERIIVCGGLHPGQSTNAVAALIAEKTHAMKFINATDVDAVYDKDPRKFKSAKKLSLVSVRQLAEILGGESVQAGAYDLMDPVALKIIARSRIPTSIVKCESKVLERILKGQKYQGTRITF